jgi:hypothetical protein
MNKAFCDRDYFKECTVKGMFLIMQTNQIKGVLEGFERV